MPCCSDCFAGGGGGGGVVAHGWQLQAVARLDCSLPLVFRFAFSSLHYQASSPSTLPIPVLLISLPCFKLPRFLPFSFSISFSPFLPSHSSFLCFKTSLPFQFQKIPLSPSKLYLSSFTSHLPVVLALLGPLAPFFLCFFPVPLSFVQKKLSPSFSFPAPSLVPLSRYFFKKNSPLLSFASAPWEQIMLRLVGHWTRLSRFGSLDFGRARGG